jgi:hypothetical protein
MNLAVRAQEIRTELWTWFELQRKQKAEKQRIKNERRLLFNTLYPGTSVDKPLRLSKLEVRWIRSFCLHLVNYVAEHPERFEGYDENKLFETYRRRLFVYWMNTFATKQLESDKRQLEAALELKRLTSRRQQLAQIACSDGWDPRSYD